MEAERHLSVPAAAATRCLHLVAVAERRYLRPVMEAAPHLLPVAVDLRLRRQAMDLAGLALALA
jgi:hypothetical protein